jgi:hypothetical protein
MGEWRQSGHAEGLVQPRLHAPADLPPQITHLGNYVQLLQRIIEAYIVCSAQS